MQALHQTSVHEGKKPFKCDICDASFSEKNDLNRLKYQFMKKKGIQV